MSRLRWPNSRHSLSDVPGTVHIDDTKRSVTEHGGKITYSGEIPTVGKLVTFEDTEGNTVRAMQYEPQALENIQRGI